jgi:hypothetical protein
MVLRRLDELAERAPDLAEPIAFYREALPLLRAAQAAVEPFSLDPAEAQRKLQSGLPLLVGEDLPLDVEAARALFLRLARIAEKLERPGAPGEARGLRALFSGGKPNPVALMGHALDGRFAGNSAALRSAAAGQIRRAVEKNQLDLVPIWQALALGDWPRAERAAAGLQLDSGLLRLLAENSLKPALRVWARGLKPGIDLDRWRRGHCPLCGSPPTLAELQGKEGARRLRCGLCGADWLYGRLQCAHCANQDYKTLGYIVVEDEQEKYSIQTCEKCHGYLKVVVTYEPTPVDLLPIEDLATLHLDLIAAERGFSRAPASPPAFGHPLSLRSSGA